MDASPIIPNPQIFQHRTEKRTLFFKFGLFSAFFPLCELSFLSFQQFKILYSGGFFSCEEMIFTVSSQEAEKAKGTRSSFIYFFNAYILW